MMPREGRWFGCPIHAELSFVQLAWKREQRPTLHGWIYDLNSGILKQIAKIDPGSLPADIFMYEFPDDPPAP